MLNTVFLMGRTTDAPRPRFTNEGKEIVNFSLAVPTYDGKSTMFVDCMAFGKTAEFCDKYIGKGVRIVVQGRLDCGSYESTDNAGNKSRKYYTRVVCSGVDFADSKKAEEKPAEPAQETQKEQFMEIPEGADEELPFK